MELRPYQKECINVLLHKMETRQFILSVLPTGAGKTVIFSSFIETLFRTYKDIRIAVCVHRTELVKQAYNKIIASCPILANYTDIACVGYEKNVSFNERLIVGSVQTFASRMEQHDLPAIHVVIVDEAHRIPCPERDSQYRRMFKAMRPENGVPFRIFGFTATPYQNGHGMIYGNGPDYVRSGETNWFQNDTPDYSISMSKLIEDNYLVPFRVKMSNYFDKELSELPRTQNDYRENALFDLMRQQIKIDYAINYFIQQNEERKHCVIFCVNIAHAEVMAKELSARGITAAAVHSKLPMATRNKIIADFEEGKIRVLCNVRILAEGWDCPKVDLIQFCCPTLSSSLYQQMVGRGLRTYKDKKDCLILDVVGNIRRHGDPEHPKYIIPGSSSLMAEWLELSRPKLVICPECGYVHLGRHVTVNSRCGGVDGKCLHTFTSEELEDANRCKLSYKDYAQKKESMRTMLSGEQFIVKLEDYKLTTVDPAYKLIQLIMYCNDGVTKFSPRFTLNFNPRSKDFKSSISVWTKLTGQAMSFPRSNYDALNMSKQIQNVSNVSLSGRNTAQGIRFDLLSWGNFN